MIHRLVVTRPFLTFIRGDIIADATQIAAILAEDYKRFVTKIAAPNTLKG